MNKEYMRPTEWAFFLFCVLFECVLLGWLHRQAQLSKVPVLRVAAPLVERVSTTLSPYGIGFEQELVEAFAKQYGYAVEFIFVSTAEEAFAVLREKKADLIAGIGGSIPSTVNMAVATGPTYDASHPVLIHSSRKHGLRRQEEMCRAPILLTADTEMESSLAEASEELDCLPWTSSTDGLHPSPVLSSLNENRARFALLDDSSYSLWQPFFPKVRPTKSIEQTIEYRWFWSVSRLQLHKDLTAFWADSATDTLVNDLEELYFGFLPKEVDYYDIHTLKSSLRKAMPRYLKTIKKEAEKNHIDPLLLSAVIYQESRFDAHATSRTGVRGLMQITQATARLLKVDRLDPHQSIKGGAKYLASIWKKFDGYGLTPWDRWFFTLASYNQGLGHVFDAMKLARSRGGTGLTWTELKKTLPLLAWKKYYKNTKHGYCRGYEAVSYVENIRYYYYIMHGLVALKSSEVEYLSPLLSAIPVHWPLIAARTVSIG